MQIEKFEQIPKLLSVFIFINLQILRFIRARWGQRDCELSGIKIFYGELIKRSKLALFSFLRGESACEAISKI